MEVQRLHWRPDQELQLHQRFLHQLEEQRCRRLRQAQLELLAEFLLFQMQQALLSLQERLVELELALKRQERLPVPLQDWQGNTLPPALILEAEIQPVSILASFALELPGRRLTS